MCHPRIGREELERNTGKRLDEGNLVPDLPGFDWRSG
jgi:hypothetical protein